MKIMKMMKDYYLMRMYKVGKMRLGILRHLLEIFNYYHNFFLYVYTKVIT